MLSYHQLLHIYSELYDMYHVMVYNDMLRSFIELLHVYSELYMVEFHSIAACNMQCVYVPSVSSSTIYWIPRHF